MIMVIVGFGFKKISLERKAPISGKVNIRSNIAVKEVVEHDLHPQGASLPKDQRGLKFSFDFIVDYGKEFGSIKLGGEVIAIESKKLANDVLKIWKKDKKVSKEILPSVLNYALSKSNVQAIALSKDINLPPPMPMPRINTDPGQKNYIG